MVVEISWSSALQILFCVSLMFVIITGNSFVVASYFSNFRLRTGTYTFLVSLAISDLLVGCVSLPLWIYVSLTGTNYGPLNTFFISFDILSAMASIFHLTTVSLERWLAISRPFVHEALSTTHYTIVICCIWMTASVIAAIRPALDKSSSDSNNSPYRIYTPFLLFVGYVGPGILVSVVNISIFKVARALISNLPTMANQEESNKIRKNLKKQRRTALTLTFVTALFLVSWLSFFTVSTISVFCRECFPFHKLSGFLLFSKWLQYSNSAMNPLVYAFRDLELRKTFVRLLSRCRRRVTIRQALRVAPVNMSLTQRSTRFRTDPTTMFNETQV